MSRVAAAPALTASAPIVPAPVAERESSAPADQSASDRRAHVRYALEAISGACKARLKFGPAVTLIDISDGGVQIETTNRIQPGSAVVLEIASQKGDLTIPATVLRCQLASLLPEPTYRGALVFKRDFDVRSLGVTPVEPRPAAELNPAEELRYLRQAIECLAIGPDGGPIPEPVLAPLRGALSAAHSTLETPAGRRAGAELGRELAILFQAVASALQRTPTPAALQGAIEGHLRQVVPMHALQMADVGVAASTSTPGTEAILLSIPPLSPQTPAARLSVEFTDGAEPHEMHLQMLKAGVQLIALARELGRLNGVDRPLLTNGPAPLPEGWCHVVACYANGQTRNGFTAAFTPTKGGLDLTSEPTSSSIAALVPFTELRAIRFVKGRARAAATEASAPKGRKVRVTFADGQQLEGTTESYRRSAPGFFVQPLDQQSDDERVFVVGSPTLQVVFG